MLRENRIFISHVTPPPPPLFPGEVSMVPPQKHGRCFPTIVLQIQLKCGQRSALVKMLLPRRATFEICVPCNVGAVLMGGWVPREIKSRAAFFLPLRQRGEKSDVQYTHDWIWNSRSFFKHKNYVGTPWIRCRIK